MLPKLQYEILLTFIGVINVVYFPVTCCSHSRNFEQQLLHFCSVKASGCILCLTLVKRHVSAVFMHDRLQLVLFRASLIQNIFDCSPGLFILHNSYQQKTSDQQLPSNWLVTTYQLLLFMNCDILLKLYRLLYQYISSNLSTVQCPGV